MLLHGAVLAGLIQYEGRSLGVVSGIFATIFSVIGFNILSLGLHAKTYSWTRRFDNDNPFLKKFYQMFTLEIGLLFGIGMVISGGGFLVFTVIQWLHFNLAPLSHPEWVTFAATLVIIGVEIFFDSLFISAMSLQKTEVQASVLTGENRDR
jgi:hypothetical protein